MSRSPEPQTEDESEWRFGIDDVGPDGIVEDSPVEEPIEPGSPQTENVAFVLLGVLLAVGLILITAFPNAI